MNKFWNWIRDDTTGGRVLRLKGPIDEDLFWGDEITPQAFRDELNAEDGDVMVWINSPGGNVFAAAEIYTIDSLKEERLMASRARRSGVCNYRLWTTEELIDSYAFEAARIDQTDRETTQRLIKEELKRRFDTLLSFLDDEQTMQNPKATFRLLLNN